MNFYNPFQRSDLLLPQEFKGVIEQYCQFQPQGGSRPSPNKAPFFRQVDFWFAAICIASNRPWVESKADLQKFNDGTVLLSDPFRIELLELMAISASGDPYIVGKPAQIIKIANDFAAAGTPELLASLGDAAQAPIWNLTNQLVKIDEEL